MFAASRWQLKPFDGLPLPTAKYKLKNIILKVLENVKNLKYIPYRCHKVFGRLRKVQREKNENKCWYSNPFIAPLSKRKHNSLVEWRTFIQPNAGRVHHVLSREVLIPATPSLIHTLGEKWGLERKTAWSTLGWQKAPAQVWEGNKSRALSWVQRRDGIESC